MMTSWTPSKYIIVPFKIKNKKRNRINAAIHCTGHHAPSSEFKKKIHRRITQDVPSNCFSKDNEKSTKKGTPFIIQAMSIELHLRSDFRTACFFVMLE